MLSVIVNSRNDDHGQHQLERLEAFIECLNDFRMAYNWDVELILVEWNPPHDRPYLAKVIHFNPDWMRMYRVPQNIHKHYENSNVIPFYFHIAHNVGIRRAKGDFILITSQDVVFSDRLARWLAMDNFDSDAFYRSIRVDTDIMAHELKKGDVWKRLEHLKDNIYEMRGTTDRSRLYTKATGDFLMMSRDNWHKLRGGFPEWGIFGVFLDGIALHAAYAMGLRQVVLDDTRCNYHIHHESQGMDIFKAFPHIRYEKGYVELCRNMMENKKPLIVNGEDWGLWDCGEIELEPGLWKLADPGHKRGMRLPKCVTYPARVG